MVVLNAAHLPADSLIGMSLASSAEWRDRLPPAHSLRNAIYDLGSICPRARRSARFSMQLECATPSWGHGTGARM